MLRLEARCRRAYLVSSGSLHIHVLLRLTRRGCHVRNCPPRNLVLHVARSRFGSGDLGCEAFQPSFCAARGANAIPIGVAQSRLRCRFERRLALVLDRECTCPLYARSVARLKSSLQTLGWVGYVKVDGTTYTWMGAPTVAGATKATQKSLTVRGLH